MAWLPESVKHRGNAQRAGLPVWLGDVYAAHGLRLVVAVNQAFTYFQPVVLEVLGKFINGHAVDARRAFVPAYLLECALQVAAFENAGEQRLGLNRLGMPRLSSDSFIRDFPLENPQGE